MPTLAKYIFGMHDGGGEHLMLNAGKPGWVMITQKASDSGGDFSGYANAGLGVIVRLNWGYGSDGTLPPSNQYDAFAQQCANYVAQSRGASIWIIGNETNLRGERPGNSDSNPGEVLTPDKIAQCFAKCRAAIRRTPGHENDWVCQPPPGPWNPETQYPGNGGDWVTYLRDILNECIKQGHPPDAIALHTYTHGYDAGLCSSGELMGPPYTSYHYHLRAYQDFMKVIPASLRNRPVLITETQPADPGWWQNRNIGWIQSAYKEINDWNSNSANQAIQALVLFRWERGDDRWSISDKGALHDDFRAAVQAEYLAPAPRALASAQPAQPKPSQPAKPTVPAQAKTQTGWCPFAKKRPIIENNFDFGRNGNKVKAVVLHIAAGPMFAVLPTFNDVNRPASAHFCVGKDGAIEQYVSIDDTAYGNGLRAKDGKWFTGGGKEVNPPWQDIVAGLNPNLYTISIEHDGQPQDKWTPQMYDANNRLLQWIAKQTGLNYVVHHTLIGHHEINPIDRPNCPGPNVEWDRMAADANGEMRADSVTEMIQATANEVPELPINLESALYKFAQTNNLGCPQSDEIDFQASGADFIAQVFMGGIVYVKKGDWGNLKWVKKPQEGGAGSDAASSAALDATSQAQLLPINSNSGIFKFAQANNLGCPQSDEFDFVVDTDYIGQVYANGFVFAKKSDPGNLQWVKKMQ
ncbi:MAG: N-acetylmuramoyl-L-alanine amidase [Chloroflexi bacterium]|nr:N-acetylmuramoyl-L-alanine amidase [Chloroflexota bacterium]